MVKSLLKTILIILCLSGIASAAVEGIVAVVNDEVITQKDLNEFAALMYLQHTDKYKDKKELEQEMQKWRQEAVERIIEDRLIIQEAKKKKLTAEPKMVEYRINEIKKRFASDEEFENTLISEGFTITDLKHKIEDQLLMREVVEKEVRDKIFVSPTEVTAYYEGYKDKIKEPEQAIVDSLFIPFQDSEGAARKQVEEALTALKKGEEFSLVAQKYSYAPSIGKIAKGQLKKEIEEVIFNLRKGEFSSIVKTENGFYIFKLTDILPPKQLTINEARDEIYRILFAEKFERQFAKWMDDLKSKAYIHVK